MLIDYQEDFDFLVDREQPLEKEGVGNLILLASVVIKPWAVVEIQILNDDLGGDGCLGVLVVANFELVVVALQCDDSVQAIVLHN